MIFANGKTSTSKCFFKIERNLRRWNNNFYGTWISNIPTSYHFKYSSNVCSLFLCDDFVL